MEDDGQAVRLGVGVDARGRGAERFEVLVVGPQLHAPQAEVADRALQLLERIGLVGIDRAEADAPRRVGGHELRRRVVDALPVGRDPRRSGRLGGDVEDERDVDVRPARPRRDRPTSWSPPPTRSGRQASLVTRSSARDAVSVRRRVGVDVDDHAKRSRIGCDHVGARTPRPGTVRAASHPAVDVERLLQDVLLVVVMADDVARERTQRLDRAGHVDLRGGTDAHLAVAAHDRARCRRWPPCPDGLDGTLHATAHADVDVERIRGPAAR